MTTTDFLSLSELGRFYRVSGRKMGQWLVKIGLRTDANRPSSTAFDEGYVETRPSRNAGSYFYVWHVERTMRLLEKHGYKLPGKDVP